MNADEIRTLLDADRAWAAYALADLYPPYREHAEWRMGPGAALLCYRGFEPPILFAHGDPLGVRRLFEELNPGVYQYALLGAHRALLKDRLRVRKEARMWRMVLPKESFIPPPEGPRARLGAADLPALQVLFEGQPDLPDAFDPSQLQDGIFYGVWEDDRLVAVAGTHVVSPEASVAAIGNVYTRRDRRGRGLGRRTTGAVAAELLASGVVTIVLNVAMDNEPALAVYRALGFMPFCGYYEGVGELAPAASNPKET